MTRKEEMAPESDAPVKEEGRQGDAPVSPPGKNGRPRRAGLRLGRMKWVLIGILGVILVTIGLKWAYPLILDHFDLFGGVQKRDITVRPEDYEPLNPFFIPMPSGRDKVAARVNVRVKWDRLTGARFKRDAVLIRERIYIYLRAFEKWSEDMEANRQILEGGIARILRQALGVKDVDVLVEDILYVHVAVLSLPGLAASRENDDQPSNMKGVCAWMNSPMLATPCWGSSPPIRWWG